MWFFLFAIVGIASPHVAQGQGAAQVTIQGVPAILPEPFVDVLEQNYRQGQYTTQLMYTGNQAAAFRWRFTVEREGSELVSVESRPVTYEPGTHIYGALSDGTPSVRFDIGYDELVDRLPSDTRRALVRTGRLPEGSYTVQLEVIPEDDPTLATTPGIAQFQVIYPEPAALVEPADGATVEGELPLFSWTTAPNVPAGIQVAYDVLIVEVLSGQTPLQAIQANRPHAELTLFNQTTFTYTPDLLPLEEGQTYAWQVQTSAQSPSVGAALPFSDDGQSEIYTFTYRPDDPSEDAVDDLPVADDLPILNLPDVPDISEVTFSGRVVWSFKASEDPSDDGAVELDSPTLIPATSNPALEAVIDDPSYEVDEGASILGENVFESPIDLSGYSGELNPPVLDQISGQETQTVPVFGGGQTGGVQIGQMPQQLADALAEETHPMSGADVRVVTERGGGTLTVGTARTNSDGDFSVTIAPSEVERLQDDSDGSVSVQIKVTSHYFDTIRETVEIDVGVGASDQDVGTLQGAAHTHRLRATVQDEEGAPLPNANVEVFRATDFYDDVPVLQPEGPLGQFDRETTSLNGQTVTKIAESPPVQDIPRLFLRVSGPTDRYLVRVTAPGHDTLITHHSARRIGYSEGEVITAEETYELQASDPMVEGRVVRADTREPLSGLQVMLVSPEDEEQEQQANTQTESTGTVMTGGLLSGGQTEIPVLQSGVVTSMNQGLSAQTGEDGRFTIADIPPEDEPYVLRVSGAKVGDYEEELLLDEKGMVVQRDPLAIDPTLVTVTGRLVNDDGEPVANAQVRWEEGGEPSHTDEEGRFMTANTPGEHVLTAQKIGHRDADTTFTVEIQEESSQDKGGDASTGAGPTLGNQIDIAGSWAAEVLDASSMQVADMGPLPPDDGPVDPMFSAANVGYYGNMDLSNNAVMATLEENELSMSEGEFAGMMTAMSYMMGEEGTPGGVQDIGDLEIHRAVGHLAVTVEDEDDGQPIEGATVDVGYAGPEGATDAQGFVFFGETPAGTVPLRIVTPEDADYVPVDTEVNVSDAGDTTEVSIEMEMGARVEGTVTAGGEPVEDVRIRVDGREDISTRSDEDGDYTLRGVPLGEWTLQASKSGYVGSAETRTFDTGTTTIDFALEDAGFDIATLMGFEIEVDELDTQGSDTTITGAFTAIPDNDLFSGEDDLRIPFSDVSVQVVDGQLQPADGQVETDATELSATALDFLSVTVSRSGGLIVRPQVNDDTEGMIAGRVEIDYGATFTGATGWELPADPEEHLDLPNWSDRPEALSDAEIVAFTSDGSFPVPEAELAFGEASESMELYGFEIELNLADARIRTDGIHLAGSVALGDIPLLDTATLTLEALWIGTDGTVREAALDLDPAPELTLAGWTMRLQSGLLSEAGFTLGGELDVDVPSSDPTQISFSELSIADDQLFGGQFELPGGGLDVFGIVSLESNPGESIAFGKVPNEDVYFVTGSGRVGLPKYIDRDLNFRDFLVRTDGAFSADVEANFEADFYGLADLQVTGIAFDSNGPSIGVDGEFGLRAIPLINAQAGGITYRPGGQVSVDDIDLAFDLSSIGEVRAGIGFVDEATEKGFRGAGGLEITSTPIDVDIDFEYVKAGSGIDFGADFQTGIPPIPLGNFSIESVGGGFGHTQSDGYRVTVSGAVTVAPGTGTALSVDPLEVMVRSGPVIEGSAAVSVLEQSIADAALTMDFPNSYFDIEATFAFDMLDDLNVSADGAARLVANGEDEYWMVGARYQVNMLDLIDANANILGAWNVVQGEYPEYTNFVPVDFVGTSGRIKGVHLEADASFGVPKKDQKCTGVLWFLEACGYFYNNTQCSLNADIDGGQYGFFLGSDWEGGGDLKVKGVDFDVAGFDAWLAGSIEGDYQQGNGWAASGRAEGQVSGYVGDCDVGCQTKICTSWGVPKGGSACVDAAVDVSYSSRGSGMSVSLDL